MNFAAVTKADWDKLKTDWGIKDDVVVSGQVFAQVPKEPVGLLLWAAMRCAEPTFDSTGNLCGWKVASREECAKYQAIVEEVAKVSGYEWKGLGAVFGTAEA